MFNGNGGGGLLADIAAVTRNNDGGNGWGDNGGIWALIILFALFANQDGGLFGGGRNNGGSCCAPATCADMQRGFDSNMAQQRFNGIDQGICSLGYDNAQLIAGVNQNLMGMQNAINQGFSGVNTGLVTQGYENRIAVNGVQQQLADCCCENREAIAQVRYDMATNTCSLNNTINNGFAQLDRTINDKFCELEMRNMQRQIDEQQNVITALNLEKSNANQTRQIIDTVRPCPTPSYVTCNPWATNGTCYTGCQCA